MAGRGRWLRGGKKMFGAIPARMTREMGLTHDVFREYQRQLWEDAASWPTPRFEDHLHKWGPIGLLFVDHEMSGVGGLRLGRWCRGITRPRSTFRKVPKRELKSLCSSLKSSSGSPMVSSWWLTVRSSRRGRLSWSQPAASAVSRVAQI